MNVSSVMNTYYLSSLWNNMNLNNSSVSTVPAVNNIDSTVKKDYAAMNSSGQTTSAELQDIYQQVEPNYGISLTYNQDGTISLPVSNKLPTNELNTTDSNNISLMDKKNSSTDNTFIDAQSQDKSIEEGNYKSSISSILSNNPSIIYNTVNSFEGSQSQSLGNIVNIAV